MAGRVVLAKVEALRQCVKRIEAKRPGSVALLKADQDLQDIVTLNLTRAVQLCVDIASHIVAESDMQVPGTMAEAFEALEGLGALTPDLAARMKRAVGFRNIAVHSYQQIDWEIVYAICNDHLGDFKAFAQAAVDELDCQ